MAVAQRYVSRELAHFVGRQLKSDEERYTLLVKVIKEGSLSCSGGTHMELEVRPQTPVSTNEMYSPGIVCFCDIPLMDFSIHIKKYGCFGLSFLKTFLVQKGAAPVLYIPKSARVNISREVFSKAQYFDIMVNEYRAIFDELLRMHCVDNARLVNLRNFFDFHILSYIKFFELDRNDDDWENYYMEREWRMFGNLSFSRDDVWRVILPSDYGKRFRNDVPDYWGQLVYID